jgi:hypothetical protein
MAAGGLTFEISDDAIQCRCAHIITPSFFPANANANANAAAARQQYDLWHRTKN